ncbi:uncharacterized protein NFIA_054980 [Aspergillus fischeri NRRL 181]|uniref:Uncharacterized protein n=1 Tax=Neosartorya fischeri (strain ATCC 1020 / DSM 3700 / CBS 544.65 / FGSC A1164 / JCM 1740 / NRRL 181 / WB 181) TaxID=331117 RepID=A1DMX9_NEOFI|nr:uncharacterized protein NFIA_054980 [Aspergillus fischeri NRRL 181]EAW16150.1 hypothetical protein NFIA_054980 [Aspergillus fischeri NRRL 181]
MVPAARSTNVLDDNNTADEAADLAKAEVIQQGAAETLCRILGQPGKLTSTDRSLVKIADIVRDVDWSVNSVGEPIERPLNSQGQSSAFLLQARGRVANEPCSSCASNPNPFQSCVAAPSYKDMFGELRSHLQRTREEPLSEWDPADRKYALIAFKHVCQYVARASKVLVSTNNNLGPKRVEDIRAAFVSCYAVTETNGSLKVLLPCTSLQRTFLPVLKNIGGHLIL